MPSGWVRSQWVGAVGTVGTVGVGTVGVGAVERVVLTTFWLARSGVSRRPIEVPRISSATVDASATARRVVPRIGSPTEMRLPASASAACQACASGQFGRHQNVSIRTRWRDATSSPASHRAARRSASVPGPRPLKAASAVVVSSGRIGPIIAAAISDRTRLDDCERRAELLAVAREAAEAAADELRARFGERARGVRSKSGPTDLVSEADLAAESAIRSVLGARRPSDAILGEEGGETGEGELRWVVDPLDGTINYLYRIPAFAVSIACEDSSGTLAGVVLDPIAEERFEATRSGEPTLNGEPIHPDGRAESLALAMLATGFNYDATVRARQADVIVRLLPRVRDIRRVGSAALDLCWCACGRYDAYFERGLNPWDVAAGSLIAARAGLTVQGLPAAEGEPAGIVAAPAALIDELVGLIVG